VDGFVQSPPNTSLLEIAAREPSQGKRLLDIGGGAGRNAVPLAQAGWRVVSTDLSTAMVRAARQRVVQTELSSRLSLIQAPMDALPFRSAVFDFVVAHGIWNLARSGLEFRQAVAEAGRVAQPGALLFVFTFSRHTLPEDATAVPGESFVFTQFSGEPQCFLTAAQIHEELLQSGFRPHEAFGLRELNRPAGRLRVAGPPVIYEGVFRRNPG
jgi:ubiquinone/menaquinone biosynthesis C-methylase UbiE